jgi:hypothetical protein
MAVVPTARLVVGLWKEFAGEGQREGEGFGGGRECSCGQGSVEVEISEALNTSSGTLP